MVDYGVLAQEHNRKVNTIAALIEKNNEMLEIAKGNVRIAIVDDNRATHYLDDYLNDDVKSDIAVKIINSITDMRDERVKEFYSLIGAGNVEKKAEEVAEQEEHQQISKKETKSKEKIIHSSVFESLDKEKFTEMYMSGASKQEIAKEFDICENTVYGYASKLGIKRNKAENQKEDKTHVELTKELVRSKYTLTDKSLDDVAKELGVTKYELHDFVAKNGLRRPSKKEQKVFRDAEVQKKRNTPS